MYIYENINLKIEARFSSNNTNSPRENFVCLVAMALDSKGKSKQKTEKVLLKHRARELYQLMMGRQSSVQNVVDSFSERLFPGLSKIQQSSFSTATQAGLGKYFTIK